jgi:hypothetical protein
MRNLRGKFLLAWRGGHDAESRMKSVEQDKLQERAVHIGRVLDLN